MLCLYLCSRLFWVLMIHSYYLTECVSLILNQDSSFLCSSIQAPVNAISIAAMAKLAIPGVSLASLTPPPGFPGLDNIFLNKLEVNLPAKSFCIGAGVAGRTITIIPGVLIVNHVTFDVCLKKVNRRTQTNLAVTGSISLGSVKADVRLKVTSRKMTATARISQRLYFKDLISALGVPMSTISSSSSLKRLGLIRTTLTVNRVKVGRGSSTSVSLRTHVLGLNSNCELLFVGLGTRHRGFVAGFTLPRVSLSKAASLVTRMSIPVIGNWVIPRLNILVVNMGRNKIPASFQFSNSHLRGLSITQGIVIQFRQRIGGDTSIAIHSGGFALSFSSPPSLDEILRQLFPAVTNTGVYKAMQKFMPVVFNLRLKRVSYNRRRKRLSMEVILRSQTIIPRLLKITDAKLTAEITTSGSKRLLLRLRGFASLYGFRLKISGTYNQHQNLISLRLESPTGRLRFQQLFSAFGSKTGGFAAPVARSLRLNSLEIIHPLFEVSIQRGRVSTFRIRGTPSLSGLSHFSLEAIVNIRLKELFVMLSVPKFSMGSMVETLTGWNLRSVPFYGMISGQSAIGITVSPERISSIPFQITTYPLNQLKAIEKGIGVVVDFQLPGNCGGDLFCKFFKLILGTRRVLFRVTGIGTRVVTVSVRLPGKLKLGPLHLFNIDLGFSFGARVPSIGLTNIEMKLHIARRSQPLYFQGRLMILPTGDIEIRLKMRGIYEKAFGFPWLAVGNIDLGVRTKLSCPATCLTQLILGGEIALGKNCYRGNHRNCVKARGFLSADAQNPDENWFYFKLNKLSLRHLLAAVGMPNIPDLRVLDFAQLSNVETSYSRKNHKLPAGLVPHVANIQAGFLLKGKASLLFLVHLDIYINVKYFFFGYIKSVDARIRAKPLHFGPVHLTSAHNHRVGPSFELKARVLPRPLFYMKFSAKLHISWIGYTRSIHGHIDNNGIQIRASGPIYGFQATFVLSAHFNNKRDPRHTFHGFTIAGHFTSLAHTIVSGIRNKLNAARHHLNRLFNAALSRLRAADRKVAQGLRYLNLKRHVSDHRRRAFNHARNKVNGARNTIRRLCRIKHCGCRNVPRPCMKQSCWGVPYPCGWSWCRSRRCVPRPGFCGSMCVQIDPLCFTKNAACKVARAAAYLAEKVALRLLRHAEGAFKVAERATAWATRNLGNLKLLSRTASAAFSGIRGTFNGITSAFNHVFNAFRVLGIHFRVSVSSLSGARVHVRLHLRVFGRRHHFGAHINLRNVGAFSVGLARRFYSRYQRFF